MEETDKSLNNKMLMIVLTALLFVLIGYTFYNNKDHKDAIQFFQEEKEQILENLMEIENKYNLAIAQNTKLSDSLIVERKRIIDLKDSVRGLRKVNSKDLRHYRNKVENLKAINQQLVEEVDSLKGANNLLIEEKDSIYSQLEIQTDYNDTLISQNMDLAKKVKIGGVINVKNVKVTAMKMRSSGKYTETNKAQKTDAIKIAFRLMENKLATPGDKKAYIRLKNPKGEVINSKGTFTTKNGTAIEYTDQTMINYNNSNLDVIMLVEKRDGEKYEKGSYPIEVYVEGKLVGLTTLELGNSFLGL